MTWDHLKCLRVGITRSSTRSSISNSQEQSVTALCTYVLNFIIVERKEFRSGCNWKVWGNEIEMRGRQRRGQPWGQRSRQKCDGSGSSGLGQSVFFPLFNCIFPLEMYFFNDLIVLSLFSIVFSHFSIVFSHFSIVSSNFSTFQLYFSNFQFRLAWLFRCRSLSKF